MLLVAATIVVAVCLAQVTSGEQAVPRCEGCNVVVISLDTLRADHLGSYGYAAPTTPNIDRLAAHGVVFEDAISQSAWTRPSHISMMTGLYPVEHGIVSMSLDARLSPSVPTLASVLRSHGYATASFNGGANLAAHFGLDTGFDVYRSVGKRLGDNVDAALEWIARYTIRK